MTETIATADPGVLQTTDAPHWFLRAIATPKASRSVKVHGVPVQYVGWNVADTGKPPLLFVHGFLAHAHWWDFIAPFFVDRFRVFAMDFSGMGDSGHRQEYDSSIWRDEIAAVISDIGTGPAVVVGHSFGGARCVEACSFYPQLFRHLVVVDSYMYFQGDPHRRRQFVSRGENRIYTDLATAMSHYRLIPEQAAPPYILRHLARHSLRRKGAGWGWKFDELHLRVPRGRFDSSAMLAGLQAPLSLVYGEHSFIATPDRMRRIAGLVPDCRSVVKIPEAHHHVMIDQPIVLVETLRSLLRW